MFNLSDCRNYEEDPFICDDIGESKGQCRNCGAKWFEHDLSALPNEEKESAKLIQDEKFSLLGKAAMNSLKQDGYVGLDYNMAVLCICMKRVGEKVKFMHSGMDYASKIDYWSSKRHFGHLAVSSENELINHALKNFNIE